MADMFYFCSPVQDNVPMKCLASPASSSSSTSSSKRRRRLVKRDPRQMARMEQQRACMARFAEPFFDSNHALVSLLPGSQALRSCEDVLPGHDAVCDKLDEGMLDGPDLSTDVGTTHNSAPFQASFEPEDDRAKSWCEASSEIMDEATLPCGTIELDRTISSSRVGENETDCQQQIRDQGHFAPATNSPKDLSPADLRRNPLPLTRMVSHQPSCDSLRNPNSLAAHALQSQLLLAASQSNLDLQQQDSLLEELRLQYNNAEQYTVLTDMAETAWAVDDPRHGADLIEDMTSWPDMTAALIKRSCAGESKLPAFNRQEAIASGVDMQGLDWGSFGISRQQGLFHRTQMREPHHSAHFIPKVNYSSFMENTTAQTERHYRFQYFNGLKRPTFTHHQLRHSLACSGRDVFFANSSKVMRASLVCPTVNDTILDLTRSERTLTPIRITCLAATDSLIIAGGFDGEYAIANLDNPSSQHAEGHVNHHRDGVVTHIHTFPHRRSHLPQAAFCANDQRLRLMDLATQTFTTTLAYPHPLNAASTASDGRLRALVGDSPDALVTDADSGETLVTLRAHSDHIFACAWSSADGGRLLATAAQDGKIALWDSRNWARPLAGLPNVMSCSRELLFSADGGLLVSAENHDVVSVFDTQSGDYGRQDIRFFGAVAGVAMVDGGDELVVANGDRSVGGLMSFRRTGLGGDGDGGFACLDSGERGGVRRRAARRRARCVIDDDDDDDDDYYDDDEDRFLWC